MWIKIKTLPPKIIRAKRAGDMVQAVQHLPGNYETLS
jgi:hypothetical protein